MPPYSIRLIRFGRNRETCYLNLLTFILRKYALKRGENKRGCKRGRKHQTQKKELQFCNQHEQDARASGGGFVLVEIVRPVT
jgi:hypothetical protein